MPAAQACGQQQPDPQAALLGSQPQRLSRSLFPTQAPPKSSSPSLQLAPTEGWVLQGSGGEQHYLQNSSLSTGSRSSDSSGVTSISSGLDINRAWQMNYAFLKHREHILHFLFLSMFVSCYCFCINIPPGSIRNLGTKTPNKYCGMNAVIC